VTFLAAGTLIALPAANAAVRVPKTTWPVCKTNSDNYCVEGVSVTTPRGRTFPLTWVSSGVATPNSTSDSKYSPVIAVGSDGKVYSNNWWVDSNQLAAITNPSATFVDLSDIAIWNVPAVGAKWDSVNNEYDLYISESQLNSTVQCQDPITGEVSALPLNECYNSAIAVQIDNQVRSLIWFTEYSGSFEWKDIAETGIFVDGSALAEQKKQPVVGATYNRSNNTFSVLEALEIPEWVSSSVLINGATAAGAELSSPDTGVAMAGVVDFGRPLSGRWTLPNWNVAGLGNLGYEGLFIDAKAANEFVNHPLVDVLPTINKSDNKSYLATQVGNAKYATHLDSDVTVKVTLRVGEIQPGVTIAVGTDVTLDFDHSRSISRLTVAGNPVTVPLAAKASDCVGENGISKANVRQFQALIFLEGETSGFGVDGVSGEMYVGSNGVCSLSTPIWNETEKSFTWQVAAPHFAPDGTSLNYGFYKAVIPFEDAALLWGLTNPQDAVTALDVTIVTEAGGSSAALANISAKNNKIIIDVSGFQYSRPKLKVALKKGWKPKTTMLNKTTITCTMGKSVKKITAVKPTCPKGYKKKN
jgi:hypothetical protein